MIRAVGLSDVARYHSFQVGYWLLSNGSCGNTARSVVREFGADVEESIDHNTRYRGEEYWGGFVAW